MRHLLIVIPTLLAAGPARPAEPQAEEPPVARLRTRHGELVIGNLPLETVSVRTRYGILQVPIADLARVEFARSRPRTDATPPDGLVAELLAAQGEARDEIQSRLTRIGLPALIPLHRELASRRGDERKLLKEIIAEVREAGPGADRSSDRIFARRFAIRGEVLLDEVQLASPYGTMRLQRDDIEGIFFRQGSWRSFSDRVLMIKSWTDADEEYQRTLDIIKQRTKLRTTEFTGSDARALRKALSKHRVMVVPELEQDGGTAARVAGEAAKAIRAWVKEGGILVSCGSDSNCRFLTATGLIQCSTASGGDATVKRRHAIVKGISGTIPSANATIPMNASGGKKMKALAATSSGGIVAGVASIGEGAIVYCGWDYFQSAEPHQKILANAVKWACGRGDEFSGSW